MEYEEKSPTPLDNDALTRLIYLHDDEITQPLVRIRQLEERACELGTKNNVHI